MMCLGMFMAILDIQVVATSLPTIQRALNIAPDEMSWIQTAYLIAEIISIPLTGFLIRAATMRWLFTVATVVFTLASIGCAFSPTFKVLIAFRVLQGFSGGTLIPTVFSAVFLMFPTRLQTIAATIAGVLAVLGPTIGPVVGGWITDAYSWPWLFLINVPAGVIASSVGFLFLAQAQAFHGSVSPPGFSFLRARRGSVGGARNRDQRRAKAGLDLADHRRARRSSSSSRRHCLSRARGGPRILSLISAHSPGATSRSGAY